MANTNATVTAAWYHCIRLASSHTSSVTTNGPASRKPPTTCWAVSAYAYRFRFPTIPTRTRTTPKTPPGDAVVASGSARRRRSGGVLPAAGEDSSMSVREEFDEWAASGRDRGMEERHWQTAKHVLARMPIEAGDVVLDLGTGSGYVLRALRETADIGRGY